MSARRSHPWARIIAGLMALSGLSVFAFVPLAAAQVTNTGDDDPSTSGQLRFAIDNATAGARIDIEVGIADGLEKIMLRDTLEFDNSVELDNSSGGQVWAGDPRFGPLAGRLLHSSFGKGWLYYMSLEEVGGQTQASIVALPHQWDAGVRRLRVNPRDGAV